MPLRRKLRPSSSTGDRVASARETCSHPVQLNNMCVSCGITLVKSDQEGDGKGKELTLVGGAQLVLSEDEALRQQELKVANLRNSRKLALVLDLDHTLIHTTACEGTPQDVHKLLEQQVHHVTIEERLPAPHQNKTAMKHFLVKKRPMLDEFLTENSKNFQLSIYTAGTRKYAEAIEKLIDPSGKLFGGRIVSRSDVANDTKMGLEKSLQRIFLGNASLALIVDDREDVWQGEQADQLILVRPFSHFKGNGMEVNNAAGMSASSDTLIAMVDGQLQQGAVSDIDDQLGRVSEVLREMHTSFYGSSVSSSSSSSVLTIGEEISTANLLRDKKRAILRGCVITFSGLIPTNEPDPAKKCMLWRLALSLGAQVTFDLCEHTTHLISAQIETRKVEGCHRSRKNTWIVHPDWLMYCRWALNKPPEKTFVMFAINEGTPQPEPKMVYGPLEPRLLEVPAAVQRDNDKLFRAAHEASGSLSGSGEDERPAKRSRTNGIEGSVDGESDSDDDVYRDFEI